ncbi:MAG: DEAD/DEAH box helicase [Gammaproteobacteria bacterium]|nr:DEAD/DEAH box helicase [Gammaproteobacteria bacterium]
MERLSLNALADFDPGVRAWFEDSFSDATDVQKLSWPRIAAGEHLLITAPTGSGKTLTAFLWAINCFATGAYGVGATRVLYISPLKALNNDIRRNLTDPLTALRERFHTSNQVFENLRVQIRSGDTTQSERQRMLRRPPELLITTPESLMLLLTTVRGRQALSTIETVILDEIHSIVDNRRGVQLMASLERLVETAGEFQRVALSATVRPLEQVARYIGGRDASNTPRTVGIVQSHAEKNIELRIRFPEAARVAAQNGEKIWEPLSDSFKDVIAANRSTLFFTNSRRMAEKITLKINEDQISPLAYAHHGSLAREIRTEVESRLKQGELKAIVATNSLEMGIDIGHLDEVVMIQSPPSIAAAIQRVGRAGHRVGETSRGSLYPTHAQDFLEAAVVAGAMATHDIEPLRLLHNPLDVLAQVVVSTVASDTWTVDDLYTLLVRCTPYEDLPREHFDLVIEMLAGRYAGTRVRDLKPRISYDRLTGTITARKGAVFALYSSGGTIPDRGYFKLRHADSGAQIGELDEEFVWEASIGQTFTLGTQNWQIQRITHNDVLVRAAQPNATAPPFWRSETYSRSFYFSQRIGAFLEHANEQLEAKAADALGRQLQDELGFEPIAAAELIDFLTRQREATDRDLPHKKHVLVEHVKTGPAGYQGPDRQQQVVLHTAWGGQVNRPIGLAIESAWRERFDSEADVHTDNNAIVIQVKDEVDPEVFPTLVTPANFEPLLRKSLEGSGFFGARFRECAGRSLLLTRQRFNQRMPLWMSRMQAKKLMTAIKKLDNFPVLLETWRTCLQDEFDMPAAYEVLTELESGEITWSVATVTVPSPFSSHITFDQINRYMYADDTPERRGQSALSDDLIRQAVFDQKLRPDIDVVVVDQFEAKAQRTAPGYAPQDPGELGEWLKERVLVPESEWDAFEAQAIDSLVWLEHQQRRWAVHRENTTHVQRMLMGRDVAPELADQRDATDLVTEFLRFYGPRTLAQLTALLPASQATLEPILASLVEDEALIHGMITTGASAAQYCDADNLETLIRFQRAANRPAFDARPIKTLPAYLARWQRFGGEALPEASEDRILTVADQLRGYPAALSYWLNDAWHSRLDQFDAKALDAACVNNGLQWRGVGRDAVTFAFADELDLLTPAQPAPEEIAKLFEDPNAGYTFLQLMDNSKQSAETFNKTFWDAVWSGHINADGVQVLKAGHDRHYQLQAPASAGNLRRTRARARQASVGWPGTWRLTATQETEPDALERLEAAKDRARVLLDRYGIVTRELANREGGSQRWSQVFGALRIMELSGEVLAGLFFEELSGPQFALPLALRNLERLDAKHATFWINATDPVSPAGLGLSWQGLPQRRWQNHLGFHAGALALVSENNAKKLSIFLDPDDPALDELIPQLARLSRRSKRLTIETINDVAAKQSPYFDVLARHMRLVRDHRGVYVERDV